MRRRLTVEELDVRLVPTFYGNQLFPLDNPWNQVISAAPVAANSGAIISASLMQVAEEAGLALTREQLPDIYRVGALEAQMASLDETRADDLAARYRVINAALHADLVAFPGMLALLETLRAEQMKLADFLDNAPVGFYSVDSDGRFLFVNQAAGGQALKSRVAVTVHLGGAAFAFLYYRYQWRLSRIWSLVTTWKAQRSAIPPA